jgi:hypothetical protein
VLPGRKVTVHRAPEALPESYWEEDHRIKGIRKAYPHPTRGRVIEFYAAEGGLRCVAVSDIRVHGHLPTEYERERPPKVKRRANLAKRRAIG